MSHKPTIGSDMTSWDGEDVALVLARTALVQQQKKGNAQIVVKKRWLVYE